MYISYVKEIVELMSICHCFFFGDYLIARSFAKPKKGEKYKTINDN